MNRDTSRIPGLSLILDVPLADRFRRHLVAALRQRGFRVLPSEEHSEAPRHTVLVRGQDVVTTDVRPEYSGVARLTLRVAGPEGEAVLAEAAAETAKELVLDIVRPLAFTKQGGHVSAEVEELLRTILDKLDGLRTIPRSGLPAPGT